MVSLILKVLSVTFMIAGLFLGVSSGGFGTKDSLLGLSIFLLGAATLLGALLVDSLKDNERLETALEEAGKNLFVSLDT